jgi:hypothetical protein
MLVAATAAGIGLAAPSASPKLVAVARGLSSPVDLLQAPGELTRLYVVEQPGVIALRAAAATPFLDVRRSSSRRRAGLSASRSPGYARRTFYVNYTAKGDGSTRIVHRAVNGRAQPAAPGVLRVAQPFANHNEATRVRPRRQALGRARRRRWAAIPTTMRRTPTRCSARCPTRRAAGQPDARAVGIGLRNPWRYSFDRATGDLWIGDVGQNEIEEIDRLPRGTTGIVNFGWNVYEGRSRFSDETLRPGKLIQPIAQYTHADGCSITGGFVYRGKAVPRLTGRYVFGDYCSGTVWSIQARGGALRKEPVSIPQLTSFGESLTGATLALRSGRIYASRGDAGLRDLRRLVPRRPSRPTRARSAPTSASGCRPTDSGGRRQTASSRGAPRMSASTRRG